MKLKDIVNIQIGYQARSRIEPNPRGHYFIIQIKDFNGKRELDYQTLTKFNPDRDIERYLLHDKDVLFLSRGHKNFGYALSKPPVNTVVAGYFYVLRLKQPEIESEYVAWYINQPPIQAKLQSLARGTNIPLIPKSGFENLEVVIPPLEIQNKIIYLSKLLKKERELQEKLSTQLDQLVCAISFKIVMKNEDKKES